MLKNIFARKKNYTLKLLNYTKNITKLLSEFDSRARMMPDIFHLGR